MRTHIRLWVIGLFTFFLLGVLAVWPGRLDGFALPWAVAQGPSATPTLTPTPTDTPTPTNTPVPTPTPTPTSRPPFIIRGEALDVVTNDGGPYYDQVSVNVTCLDSGQVLGNALIPINRLGEWEFHEFATVSSPTSPLPDPTTFEVRLVAPVVGVEPIRAVTTNTLGTVQSKDLIVFNNVSPGTYDGNVFYYASASCPWERTETQHFAINWCNDTDHPDYPFDRWPF